MSKYRYTLDEIDRMRRAINTTYFGSGAYYATERSAEIEDRLRTYMMAGVRPESLEEKAQEHLRYLKAHESSTQGATRLDGAEFYPT